LMVAVTDPRLGETVLDPASGTGGFLVEAYNHLAKQVKTVADRRVLQERSLFGCEPKTLPYLLCQMNLLLHGLDSPQIDPGNSLRFKLTDIGERDRVDVILTNPPFGGEEEKGIQGNFPEDKQTAETALLFLQLIMRKLRRVAGGNRTDRPIGPISDRRGRRWWCRMAHCLGMACAHGSRRNCSRNSTSTPLSGCPMACLRLTQASRRTCCSSTAPSRRAKSGITSSRCPRGGRTTPRRRPSSSRISRHWSVGGTSGGRTSAPGVSLPPNCWRPAATSTGRTRAPRRISRTCRLPSSRRTF